MNNSGLSEADELVNDFENKLTGGMTRAEKGINDVNDSADDLNKTLANSKTAASDLGDGMNNTVTAAKEIGQGADYAASGLEDAAAGAASASVAVNMINNGISQFDDGVANAENSLNAFKDKLKGLANTGLDKISHPIRTIKEALGSAANAGGGFVSKLKSIGKIDIKSAVAGIVSIKNALTQGKSGISGFANALKNIGKVSVVGAVNGIKSIVTEAKNGFPNLQKIAKQKFGPLISGLAKVGSELKSIAAKAGQAALSVAKISLKGLGVGAAAAGTAIGAVVGKSVQAYADYEQLTGGVETLFGTGGKSIDEYADSVGKTVSEVQSEYNKLTAAQETVMSNAREAYKSAGMSANEYMDTVTGFSASLISSVGGDTTKAADLANQALIDMSDNANKMGTDMESIKNAYQGFAKQNYTMLDNLKLGYGGTQEEMQRLLSDAEKLTEQKYDISSFADVTEAIHAIQTEMDITGTTAKEAEHTISGSLNAMKGVWSNVLADLVNGGGDLDNSINALVKTATAFGKNIIPAIESALSGVGKLIEGLSPMIGQVIPVIVSTLLPTLTNSAVSLVQSFVNSIVSNGATIAEGLCNAVLIAIQGLVQLVPMLISAASMLIRNLITGLTEAAPQLIDGAVAILNSLVNGLVANLPMLVMSALQLVMALAQGLLNNLPKIINAAITLITGFIQGIVSMIPQIIVMGIQLVIQLAVGLIQAIPQLIAAVPQIVSAIWDGITSVNWIDLGIQIIKGIWDGIKSLAGSIWDGIKSLFTGGGDTGEIDAAAANAGSSYTASLNNSINTTSVDTMALSSNLNVDLSMQGTQSAATWSNSFNTGLSGESASLTPTTEQVKTTMNVDLTEQGTQSATTWTTGFNIGITNSGETLSAAMESVKAIVGADLSSQAATSCSGVLAAVSSMCTTITSTTQAASKTVIAITKSCGSAVIASVTSTMSRFNSVISSGMNKAVLTVKSGASSIKSTLSNLNLSSIGSNMIQGLIKGVNSKKNALLSAIRTLANAANDEMKKVQDINSPSKVWRGYGEYIVEGLNLGVTDNIPKAEKTANSLAGVYTPETDESVTTNNNSNVTETTTYNPQFNLTISGSNDDRAMERKVKKWILEALAEADEAMQRKQRTVQVF